MKNSRTEIFDRRNYLPLHVATFVLVLLSFLTARRIVPDTALVLLIIGSSIGFCISWYVVEAEKTQKWIIVLANVSSLIIAIWFISLLLHTEFLYAEIIRVLVKALIVAQLVLSFILFSPKRYSYIQTGTIFVVLCSIVIEIVPGWKHFTLVILYIFTWIVLLRLWLLIESNRNIKNFIGTTS